MILCTPRACIIPKCIKFWFISKLRRRFRLNDKNTEMNCQRLNDCNVSPFVEVIRVNHLFKEDFEIMLRDQLWSKPRTKNTFFLNEIRHISNTFSSISFSLWLSYLTNQKHARPKGKYNNIWFRSSERIMSNHRCNMKLWNIPKNLLENSHKIFSLYANLTKIFHQKNDQNWWTSQTFANM